MSFEWKDLITPLATITAAWLGARLALTNDIRKKALELETVLTRHDVFKICWKFTVRPILRNGKRSSFHC